MPEVWLCISGPLLFVWSYCTAARHFSPHVVVLAAAGISLDHQRLWWVGSKSLEKGQSTPHEVLSLHLSG